MELIYLYLLPVTVALAWMLLFIATGRYKPVWLSDTVNLHPCLPSGGGTESTKL